MHFYRFFNYFIPARRAKAITGENFVPAKQDSGCAKEVHLQKKRFNLKLELLNIFRITKNRGVSRI